MFKSFIDRKKFVGSYIGDRVGFEFRLVMVKWGIEKKVKVIIVDNVLNMDIVIQVLGNLKLGCFVYIYNFVLNKVLNDFLFLKVFGKVRLVVIFFYKSNIVIEFLKVKQEGFNLFIYRLIMDCKIRWNFIYSMLERFFEYSFVILVILFDENIKCLNQKGKIVVGMLDLEI